MFGDTLGSGAKSRICYYRNIDRKSYEITVAYPLSDDLQGHSTIQSFHMQFFLEFSSMHSSLLTRFDKKHRGPSLIVDTDEPLVPWRGAGSKTGLVWRQWRIQELVVRTREPGSFVPVECRGQSPVGAC